MHNIKINTILNLMAATHHIKVDCHSVVIVFSFHDAPNVSAGERSESSAPSLYYYKAMLL